MKIIARDNYARDIVSDRLVKENVDEIYGLKEVERLNNYAPTHDWFYVLVADDHKLYTFEP